jgi:hypothetical protein
MKIKVGLNVNASMMMFSEWPGTQEREEASHQGHHLQGI